MKKDGEQNQFLQELWRKLNRKADESGSARLRHSASYHSYFRGYTEVRAEKPGGGYRIKRYYTAPWYVHEMTDRRWVAMKLGYTALFAASVLCFVLGLRGTVTGNTLPAAIPAGAALILSLLSFAVLAELLVSKRKMTLGTAEATDKPLIRWTRLAAIAMWLAALGQLAALIVYLKGRFFLQELPGMLLVLLAGGLMFMIGVLQKRVRYGTVENHTGELDEIQNGESHLIT